ncbi:MerR family transcriptional regulator [Micromonospora sp. NPDC048935]|uniref:MerR family transcriptional regulator n=1 Tax=Micromonospora sp. NPDC048935 TaxID=3364262 RepID=UPI00371E02D6
MIGELSRRTGVPAHLLRYYESQGLLEPRRSKSGYREYVEDALLTVAQIRNLLDAGLSTREIASILPCVSGPAPDIEACPQLVDTLHARLRRLDESIGALVRSRRALLGYIAVVEGDVSPPYEESKSFVSPGCAHNGHV